MDILDTNNNNGQSRRSHSHTTMVMNHGKTIPIYPRQLLLPQLGRLPPFSSLRVMGTATNRSSMSSVTTSSQYNYYLFCWDGRSPSFRRPLGQLSMLLLLVAGGWLRRYLWLLSVVSEWVACIRTYITNDRIRRHHNHIPVCV
jgi:hypothetical protein